MPAAPRAPSLGLAQSRKWWCRTEPFHMEPALLPSLAENSSRHVHAATVETSGVNSQNRCKNAVASWRHFEKLAMKPLKNMSKKMNTPKSGEFCWNELITANVPAAKKFYSGLLGWKTKAF